MAILSIFVVAARRLWSTRWLALASAVGLVVVVSLTLSVPIYSDAVYHRILQEDMAAWGDARRPPFSFMYRYVGDMSNPTEWSEVAAADQMMQAQLPGMLGLPRQMLVRYFATAAYPVFASGDAYESQRQALTRSPFGMMNDLSDHITLMDGTFPADMAGGALDEAMPVLVSKLLANKLGWQVGERYLAFDEFSAQHEATQAVSQIPIVVSGIWEPRDDTEFYWYSNPDALQSILFTTEGNFMRRLAPQLKGEQYLVVWYMLFDGSGVRSGDVPGLLERMGTALTRAAGVLPNVRLDHSPAEALKRYERTSNLLMVQLFAFSVPILVLTFVFIALVAGLTVNNQHNEIAVLRSRGASVTQILGIALLEALVLGALALGASAPAGERIAQLVGQTRSFMDFVGVGVNASSLPTAITLDSLRTGLITVGLAVLITVTPTLGAAGYTVVTYKQQRARALRPPWWQRTWLDVLIFIPAAYGTYLLQKQGVVAVQQVISQGSTVSDPFSNPLLFLVPMLAMIALSLFALRVLPLLLRALTWLLGLLPGTSMLLAIRQLARSPSFYAAPILLLTLTLALATFTSSLAATLDQNLVDRVRYRVGGDMSLVESLDGAGGAASLGDGVAYNEAQSVAETDRERAIRQAQAQNQKQPVAMAFIPVEEHTRVDGVLAAARVGRYPVHIRLSGNNLRGDFVGVDRLDYGRVSYWRSDFASAPLGTLMNALAVASDGVLIPEPLMSQYGLRIGDPIIGRVSVGEGSAELKMRVVGTFRLWPGWYPNPKKPNDGLVFVGNLDYLFEMAGWQAPYRVWLKLDDSGSVPLIAQGLNDKGFNLVRYESVKAQIEYEQGRPERQGLFGMLSVGFVAAALLTVLGFFLYSVFSFRRRLIELGVLRAIGFSALQMAGFLGWELMLLLGMGIAVGTALGVLASRVYIPFMQVGTSSEVSTVPFQVMIAWPDIFAIYALFGGLFVVALLVLLVLMMRMKVFQAVKLGESL